MSHLLQMRGLKQEDIDKKWAAIVASFTDAWIETYRRIYRRQVGIVASFTDAWIETHLLSLPVWIMQSHLLQMRGLKHDMSTI